MPVKVKNIKTTPKKPSTRKQKTKEVLNELSVDQKEFQDKIIEELKNCECPAKRVNFGNLFLGLIVVLVGAIYFANTFGVFPAGVDFYFWNLWPVILIYIGLSILSTTRFFSAFLGVIFTILIFFTIVIAFFSSMAFDYNDISYYPEKVGRSKSSSEINIHTEPGINELNLNILTGAGTISLRGDTIPSLVEGSFDSNFLKLDINARRLGRAKMVDLVAKGDLKNLSSNISNNLDLVVTNGMPVSLKANIGGADVDLNLEEVEIKSVDIDAGVSELKIKLGDKIQNNAILHLNAGASSIKILLPKDIGVRIKIESGLVNQEISNFSKVTKNTYVSENFYNVTKSINLDLRIGVADLDIDWY